MISLSGWLPAASFGWWPLAVAVALALGYVGAPLWLWSLAAVGSLWLCEAGVVAWSIGAAALILLNLRPLRSVLVSRPLMGLLRRLDFLPAISDTERAALEAGTVWVDGDLFSGRPDLRAAMREPYPDLNAAERAFLEGPVAEVCGMTDAWADHGRGDLSPEVWQFLRDNGFFGLVIPREYGGLGFSVVAHSAVVGMCASRSVALGITVMVPNSLGPAELLLHHGTEEQRRRWLPQLASGKVLPAFALTEPHAGSDAGAIESHGVLFREPGGAIRLRLNWRKRYITLAAVADVLGLAFQLRDPDGLLGRGPDLGITCALVPTDTAGVVLGRRHDPLGVPFYNCPTEGRDVIVPVDAILGGIDGAGRGWRMLMESLAAGRGVSLPASSCAGMKRVARVVGAHAAVRQQFGMPIGRFGGVQEVLARIGGLTWLGEAARRYTLGGLERGARPSVITAIVKLHSTEMLRRVVNDGMDLLGGAGIARGPRNTLAAAYASLPIGITVEGANILTRTLMVFGQGAIRCHRFARDEIEALARGDARAFDRALFGHVGHLLRNGVRALLLSLTRGRVCIDPGVHGPLAAYGRRLMWVSASFAFLADVAMTTLGARLKRLEAVTGRFSDILSWMYLATAALRRFEAEGRRDEDLPFLRWSLEHALARIDDAFDGLYRNLPLPTGLAWLLRGPVAWWARVNACGRGPDDRLGVEVARLIQIPGHQRDRLTAGIHVPPDGEPGQGMLELALRLAAAAEPVRAKLRAARRNGRLPHASTSSLLDRAVTATVITAAEAEAIRVADAAAREAIQVDDFPTSSVPGTFVPTTVTDPKRG